MELREKLADYAHAAWVGWMVYLFSKGVATADGSLILNAEYVKALTRQMETDYNNLSEPEKNSDRKEADKMITLFKGD